MGMKRTFADSSINVHHYEECIETQKRILEKSNMSKGNKQLITDFINFCENGEGKIGLSRVRLYYYALRRIGESTDKNFKDMTEKDIVNVLAKLKEHKIRNGNSYSEHTMEDFRKAISKFWRWLYYEQYFGEAPPQIKRIKVRCKKTRTEPEIYSTEEIKTIINNMSNSRDKAFISCLYDLQARVGELLSRQIKHVRHNEEGDIQIMIDSTKTGIIHWETLFESVSDFNMWLSLHPERNTPNAPLWITMKAKGEIIPLKYASIRKIFNRICKQQGIRKGLKNNLHMLRKSKATHDMANGVPIPFIESRGSWIKGSRALQDCYIAVMQKDKDNAYKKRYQMKVNNETANGIELKRCSRCNAIMKHDLRFCSGCGMPVDMKTWIEKKEIETKTASLIDPVMLSEMVKKVVLEEMSRRKVDA
ncbi:MAG: tyrosine-type recombinase/integrase [Candidatus Aenigmarchaeota archaeon]|nr:tyrosine-type recombinase/integrase [Candidatus Aenigmarchaeota archaeon]